MMKKAFLLVAAAFVATSLAAQNPMMQPIPADSALRTGTLANGMTYYIRHNEKPKGQADFYIFDRVGSVQEDSMQHGLAHFLEHMAFNGTKNLPDKELMNYLERIGVKFGDDLNAYTKWDETCYNIDNVPTTREGIIDSALLVLHDWSHFISLKPDEIDKERGVIMGEKRQRDGGSWRGTFAMVQALGKGSPYEHNNLIGEFDYLQNFKYQQLIDYYNQWYNPKNQALVIVGDLDAAAVEQKLKTLMSDIPAPGEGASIRQPIAIPDNKEPIVSIFTDPEMDASEIQIFVKRDATPREVTGSVAGEAIDMLKGYLSIMENARLREIMMRPNAPFTQAGLEDGLDIMPTIDAMNFVAFTQNGKLADGFRALYTELEKVQRFGFTESEFERAQNDLMRVSEQKYANRNDRTNNSFVQLYIDNFRRNAPMEDAATEWQMDSTLIKSISLQDVNQFVKQTIYPQNQVIFITSPQRDGLAIPTDADILAIRDEVSKADLQPYADTTVKEPLISDDVVLKGSPVKETTEDASLGTTEWTLANGVKIVVKPTAFKADEIRMDARAKGGMALLSDADYSMGQSIQAIVAYEGVGKFSATDLQKQLSGKTAAVDVSASQYTSDVTGYTSPKDLETMLQLVYLHFTQPRFNENDFKTMQQRFIAQFANAKTDPNYLFEQKSYDVLYGNSPRKLVISDDLINKFDFKALPTVYKTLFPDANSFTFTFVGNVDLNLLKPLVEKYIGSIPVSKKAATWFDDHRRTVKGAVDVDFNVPMQTPKVTVRYAYTGEMPYTLKNRAICSFLTQAVNSRLLETLREDEGGVYSPGVGWQGDFFPVQDYMLQIIFDTNTAQADKMCQITEAEVKNIADNGPESETIEKTREYLLKDLATQLQQNAAWVTYIQAKELYNVNYVTDYEAAIKSVTAADVQAFARKMLADGNRVKLTMHPEETPATPAVQQAK